MCLSFGKFPSFVGQTFCTLRESAGITDNDKIQQYCMKHSTLIALSTELHSKGQQLTNCYIYLLLTQLLLIVIDKSLNKKGKQAKRKPD